MPSAYTTLSVMRWLTSPYFKPRASPGDLSLCLTSATYRPLQRRAKVTVPSSPLLTSHAKQKRDTSYTLALGSGAPLNTNLSWPGLPLGTRSREAVGATGWARLANQRAVGFHSSGGRLALVRSISG